MRRFHRAQHHLPDLVATIKQGPRCKTAWDFPRWRWEEPELPHESHDEINTIIPCAQTCDE
jgi:hypothetical protein